MKRHWNFGFKNEDCKKMVATLNFGLKKMKTIFKGFIKAHPYKNVFFTLF